MFFIHLSYFGFLCEDLHASSQAVSPFDQCSLDGMGIHEPHCSRKSVANAAQKFGLVLTDELYLKVVQLRSLIGIHRQVSVLEICSNCLDSAKSCSLHLVITVGEFSSEVQQVEL